MSSLHSVSYDMSHLCHHCMVCPMTCQNCFTTEWCSSIHTGRYTCVNMFTCVNYESVTTTSMSIMSCCVTLSCVSSLSWHVKGNGKEPVSIDVIFVYVCVTVSIDVMSCYFVLYVCQDMSKEITEEPVSIYVMLCYFVMLCHCGCQCHIILSCVRTCQRRRTCVS